MLDVASPQLYGLWAAIAACSWAASFSPRPGLRASGDRVHEIAGKPFLVVSDGTGSVA